MNFSPTDTQTIIKRCAIYTRKSTEEGLDQDYNTLDAQRDACENYIRSQASRGWEIDPTRYDDGGFSGANIQRPAFTRLLAEIRAGRLQLVVVYKVDRLSRSLADFTRVIDGFNQAGVSFVSVTQHFDTSSSLGRMTLNILMTFAQFEREMISERISDKIASSRKRGKYTGGMPVLGYDTVDKKLVINPDEAYQITTIFNLYLKHKSINAVAREINGWGWTIKLWKTKAGSLSGGRKFTSTNLNGLLRNPIYIGKVRYKGDAFEGEHLPIVDPEIFEKVQQQLTKNRTCNNADKRRRLHVLLRGILVCGTCGSPMMYTYTMQNKGRKYCYYLCRKRHQKTWVACDNARLPAGKTEDFVIKQIAVMGQNPDLIAGLIENVQARRTQSLAEMTQEESLLEKQLKILHTQNQELLVHSTNPKTDSLRLLLNQIEQVQTRIKELNRQTTSLTNMKINPQEISDVLMKFTPIWDKLTGLGKTRILKMIFEKIIWHSKEESLDFIFNPLGISLLKNTGADYENLR